MAEVSKVAPRASTYGIRQMPGWLSLSLSGVRVSENLMARKHGICILKGTIGMNCMAVMEKQILIKLTYFGRQHNNDDTKAEGMTLI